MADSFPVGVIRYWPETGYVYPYTNDSMRQAVYSSARGNLLSMLAQINYKRGRITEAKQNIDAALKASMDKETADNAAWFFRQTNQFRPPATTTVSQDEMDGKRSSEEKDQDTLRHL